MTLVLLAYLAACLAMHSWARWLRWRTATPRVFALTAYVLGGISTLSPVLVLLKLYGAVRCESVDAAGRARPGVTIVDVNVSTLALLGVLWAAAIVWLCAGTAR